MEKSGIEIGSVAPPFALLDQDGRRVDLKGLREQWVVLYFYPKDDTPGCTIEACEFTEGIEAFADLDAVVLGCSPDSSEDHRFFRSMRQCRGDLASRQHAQRRIADPRSPRRG